MSRREPSFRVYLAIATGCLLGAGALVLAMSSCNAAANESVLRDIRSASFSLPVDRERAYESGDLFLLQSVADAAPVLAPADSSNGLGAYGWLANLTAVGALILFQGVLLFRAIPKMQDKHAWAIDKMSTDFTQSLSMQGASFREALNGEAERHEREHVRMLDAIDRIGERFETTKERKIRTGGGGAPV